MPLPAAPTPRRTLLYVEDDLFIQFSFLACFAESDFRIVIASDGAQALAALETEQSVLTGLITDVNLGSGPDGWAVAQAARRLIDNLPVVYVSSTSDAEWRSNGVRNSVIVSKPCSPADVLTAMTSLAPNDSGAIAVD